MSSFSHIFIFSVDNSLETSLIVSLSYVWYIFHQEELAWIMWAGLGSGWTFIMFKVSLKDKSETTHFYMQNVELPQDISQLASEKQWNCTFPSIKKKKVVWKYVQSWKHSLSQLVNHRDTTSYFY